MGGSMSSVIITGDTSGAITLAAPTVAGTNTLTLPASTGTVSINGPAFSAYQTTATSVTTSATKITFDTEEFDTNNNFASSRFTPTVAGYYQVNAQLQPVSSYTGGYIQVYKNGSVYKSGNYTNVAVSLGGFVVSTLVYCNGSTDYLEIYGTFTTAQNSNTGIQFTYFNGCLLRGA
jgi:hypothetical protein